MSSLYIEFTFAGHKFDGTIFTDYVPYDELVLIGQDLVDHIEKEYVDEEKA